MLIGYGQPDNIGWSLQASGGAPVFLTSSTALCDGRPARPTRVTWPVALPATADYVAIKASWTEPTPIRIVALLGLSGIPVGTEISLWGRRATDIGYTYGLDAAYVRQLADGSHCAWWVLDEANDNLTGLSFQVNNHRSNPLDGVGFELDDVLSFGEAVILQGVEIEIENGWSCEVVDPSTHQRTIGGQLASVARRTWRQLDVQLTKAAIAQVRGGGLANGADWVSIIYSLSGVGRGALIPRWGDASSVDMDEVYRTAAYGRLSAGATVHEGGDYYSGRWVFEEVPPA